MSIIIPNAIKETLPSIEAALVFLKQKEVIAFPTETVYGLGVDLFDDDAVRRIYELKNRDYSNPLTAYLAQPDDINILAINIPEEFYLLSEAFLPGPLAIVLEKKKEVSTLVTGGKNSIAIRIPDNKITLELIKQFGKPLAATSSNLSGGKSAVTAEEVKSVFADSIKCIIDGGKCKYGTESTVIDLSKKPFSIIRHGVVSENEIAAVLKR